MKTTIRVGAGIAALLTAQAAWAQGAPDTVSASNPAGIAAAMRYAGYPVDMKTGTLGDPMIATEFSGYAGAVYFYGCDEKTRTNCTSVQFSVGFDGEKPMALADLNTLMATRRYASSHVDADGDVWVQYDVITLDGIPAPVFLKALDDFSWVAGDISDAVFAGDD